MNFNNIWLCLALVGCAVPTSSDPNSNTGKTSGPSSPDDYVAPPENNIEPGCFLEVIKTDTTNLAFEVCPNAMLNLNTGDPAPFVNTGDPFDKKIVNELSTRTAR